VFDDTSFHAHLAYKDLLTSQDVSDVNIIESVISDMSEDSQTDDDAYPEIEGTFLINIHHI
jgi:acetyl-CoA carboxylase alpha subunit